MLRVPIALDQRALDEQRARQLRVDRAVGDGAPGDDRQPVQRRALGRDDRAALALPARLGVRALDQVPGERLDPARLDLRRGVAEQARRLDELGDHRPCRRLARERRARRQREARTARARVLTAAGVAHADMREQPRQQRAVNLVGLRRVLVDLHPDRARGAAQRSGEILPLTDAQVVQVLRVAHPAKAVSRALLLLRAQMAPEVEKRDEVRALVLEAGVVLVGLGALVGRAHARVLDRQRRRDDDHLFRAAQAVGLEHHPPHARIDRELREAAAELRQSPARVLRVEVERAELVQQQLAVAHLAAVGRIEEAEVLDLAQAQRLHLQDHRGQ